MYIYKIKESEQEYINALLINKIKEGDYIASLRFSFSLMCSLCVLSYYTGRNIKSLKSQTFVNSFINDTFQQ